MIEQFCRLIWMAWQSQFWVALGCCYYVNWDIHLDTVIMRGWKSTRWQWSSEFWRCTSWPWMCELEDTFWSYDSARSEMYCRLLLRGFGDVLWRWWSSKIGDLLGGDSSWGGRSCGGRLWGWHNQSWESINRITLHCGIVESRVTLDAPRYESWELWGWLGMGGSQLLVKSILCVNL